MEIEITKVISDIQKHIEVLNDEFGGIETAVAILQTDVAWLKRFFFILVTVAIATLGTAIWNLILHKRNGKK